jgi:hypothetical protein
VYARGSPVDTRLKRLHRLLLASRFGLEWAVRYLGTIHDFVMLHALADTQAAKAATAQDEEFLRTVRWDT